MLWHPHRPFSTWLQAWLQRQTALITLADDLRRRNQKGVSIPADPPRSLGGIQYHWMWYPSGGLADWHECLGRLSHSVFAHSCQLGSRRWCWAIVHQRRGFWPLVSLRGLCWLSCCLTSLWRHWVKSSGDLTELLSSVGKWHRFILSLPSDFKEVAYSIYPSNLFPTLHPLMEVLKALYKGIITKHQYKFIKTTIKTTITS